MKSFVIRKKQTPSETEGAMHENNWGPWGDICSPEIIIILTDFCVQTHSNTGGKVKSLFPGLGKHTFQQCYLLNCLANLGIMPVHFDSSDEVLI